MKFFLAFAVLATSATALASSRDIYDIMYLPNAGTTYGFTTGSLLNAKLEADGGDTDIAGYQIEQTIGHSFTDRFLVQASLNYTDLQAEPDGESSYDYSAGLSDPRVEARFRTMDENILWDIIGGVQLGIQDGESDVNSDGNIENDNHQGGHVAYIGTQLGAKSENFQWAVLGRLTHNFKAETEYDTPTGNTTIEDDAYNELQIRADILNKLAEKSFLRSNIEANFAEGYEDDQDTMNGGFTTYQIGTEYQHQVSQDLLLRLGVDYGKQNQYTGQIDDITLWTWRFGANYQF